LEIDLSDIHRRGRASARFAIARAGAAPVNGAAAFGLAARAAGRLRAGGVRPGDVLLHQGPQNLQAFVLFWAAVSLGAVFAPVDPDWPDYQLARAVRFAPAAVACATGGSAAAVCGQAPLIPLGPDFEAWLGDAEPVAPVMTDPQAPAAYLFTSGSTGTPKAVVLSRRALAHSGALAVQTFGWRPGQHLVNLPEPHTMSGLRNAFVAAPLAELVWTPLPPRDRPDLVTLMDRLAEAGCEQLVCGPLLVRHLALLADRLEPDALATLRAIFCTGANLGPVDAARVHARFGAPVVNYYGLTETGGLCLSQSPETWSPADESLGRPVGCETRLVDLAGRSVAEGAVGELLVRSPQLMSGYLDDAAATAARLDEEGWLHTGDLMRQGVHGFELVGRSDGFINTAATERVHPEEIETVLEEHEAVAEAAVCGLTGPDGFERISALVVPARPAATDLPGRLAAYVAERLGTGRRPSQVRLVDHLPRRDNGKLIRGELKSLFDDA
jgi:acyl-coenzyme A synthetase/AMP-(fatty) acid ligase